MGILFSFILIFLLIFLVIVFVVFGFLRSLFSFRWLKKQEKSSSESFTSQKKRSKVFDTNEGEYADFEEVR